jgi:hypothetical protein
LQKFRVFTQTRNPYKTPATHLTRILRSLVPATVTTRASQHQQLSNITPNN